MFFPPLSSSNARTVCMRARVSCIYGRFVARDETNRKKRETAGRRREREQRRGGKNVRVLEEEDCTRGLRPVPAVERVCTGVRDDTLYIEAPLTAHPP